MACVSGQHEVVKTLVKRAPGLILREDDCKMAASHYAAWAGSVKCVKVLYGHPTWREGVAQRDLWGRTPLIIASAKVCIGGNLSYSCSSDQHASTSMYRAHVDQFEA